MEKKGWIMTRRLFLWLPFASVVSLFAAFWIGLKQPGDHTIASQVVGKTMPEFTTGPVLPGQTGFATADFRDGKPRLLNIFGSWCVPCLREIPMLHRLKAAGAEIDGIAIHDSTADLSGFLAANGNPYARIGLDDDGRAQLAFGSAGVPETFVVDGNGKIIYQHIGVVTDADVPRLLAMLEVRP